MVRAVLRLPYHQDRPVVSGCNIKKGIDLSERHRYVTQAQVSLVRQKSESASFYIESSNQCLNAAAVRGSGKFCKITNMTKVSNAVPIYIHIYYIYDAYRVPLIFRNFA